MKRILFIFAILVIALGLTGQARASAPRVALMDFVSDDNSYRSTVALGNLVSALQAEVSGDTNYDWVERAELEKAANEFKLAGLGFIDRSEAIRSGRWVKADWGIFGDVSTNFNGNRTLALEIVNLQRADVLAETNLMLLSGDSGPFQMKADCVPEIASGLRAPLIQAHDVYIESEKQETVAFLFLSLKQNGSEDAFAGLDSDFRQALFAESAGSQRYHFIQFQRAGAAMDEASLVLSGLAETDSNSWTKVADHYVWGEAEAKDLPILEGNISEWHDVHTLDVKLHVWDEDSVSSIPMFTSTNLMATNVFAPGVYEIGLQADDIIADGLPFYFNLRVITEGQAVDSIISIIQFSPLLKNRSQLLIDILSTAKKGESTNGQGVRYPGSGCRFDTLS